MGCDSRQSAQTSAFDVNSYQGVDDRGTYEVTLFADIFTVV